MLEKYGSVSAESGSETLVSEPRGSVSSDVPSSTLTPNELLELLGVSHLAQNEDEYHVLRHGRSVDAAALSAASLMLRTRQVQQLLGILVPGIILVEGCGDRSQTSRVSPISVVCVTLAHTLRTRPASVALLFLCGRHVDGGDGVICGPQGLMRSLLAQLILVVAQNNWISDFSQIGFPGGEEETEWKHLALHDVCLLFHQMLESIPCMTEVFCLVDGISFFERDDWCHDYDMVMNTFARIIENQNLNVAFKLLITTPTRSSRLSNLESHQRVALRNNGTQGSLRAALRTVE